tara:strand:+ start:29 stop:778 length:750 start_codon:yes stop_codon:yes gene_type:complete
MLRNAYLHGELGDKFVPHFEIDCTTPAEVFRCLDANFGGVKEYFLEKAEEGVDYHIEVAGTELEYVEELLMDVKEGDIIITPVPAGSKGIGKILAAIAIIAVVVYTGGQALALANASAAMAGTATTAVTVGSAIAATGTLGMIAVGFAANLALVGLQEMMAPDPSVDTQVNDEAYLFNGAQQNIQSGDPVPVLYGRLKVPGQPISFEVIGESATQGYGIMGMDGESVGGAAYSVLKTSKDFNFVTFAET